MIWRGLLFLWIAVTLVVAFLKAPLVAGLDETTRVLYFHIPAAWVTVVALAWSMIASFAYLGTRRLEHDDVAAGSAELGILFCVATTVSGAIWAKARWGAFWNWDPRETSILFLLLIYGAYLALRASLDDPEKRARLSAVYSVVAFVSVPFLVFIVPRMIQSTLHPDLVIHKGRGMDMAPLIAVCFSSMLVGFTVLFFWMLSVRVRVGRLERRLLEARPDA